MQILSDIYLLDGFAYAAHPNFYLLHSAEGNVIVDAGTVPADHLVCQRRPYGQGNGLQPGAGLARTVSAITGGSVSRRLRNSLRSRTITNMGFQP